METTVAVNAAEDAKRARVLQRYERVAYCRKHHDWPTPQLTSEQKLRAMMIQQFFQRMQEELGMDDLAVFTAAGFGTDHEAFGAFRFGTHTCPEKVIEYCRKRLDPTAHEEQ